DLDRDGHPDIITGIGRHDNGASADRLAAFNYDGTFKWMSALTELASIDLATPALADLDSDGLSEIVLGRQVFNSDGTLRWTGTGGKGDLISIVVDLDLDGKPEVVAGNTAYRANG